MIRVFLLIFVYTLSNCKPINSSYKKLDVDIIDNTHLLNWIRIPGYGGDVATGFDGSLYMSGELQVTRNPVEGSRIYKWNISQQSWTEIGGLGEGISVDTLGRLWITNGRGQLYHQDITRTQWIIQPGAGIDVACGRDGSVYIIGTNYVVHKWSGNTWVPISAVMEKADRIAAGPDGTPWIIVKGNIYQKTGDRWIHIPGPTYVNDIAIGNDGSVWVMSRDGNRYAAYKKQASSWLKYIIAIPEMYVVYGGRIAILDNNLPVIILDSRFNTGPRYGDKSFGAMFMAGVN